MRSKIPQPKHSGFSLIEMLAATLVVMVGIVALFACWTTASALIVKAETHGMAENLARANLEKVKVHGFDYLPKGTRTVASTLWGANISTVATNYDAGSGTAVIGMQTGATEYFDASGNSVAADADSSLKIYSLVREVADVDVLDRTTDYDLQQMSRRIVRVMVYRTPDSTNSVVTMATILASGGM